MSAKREIFNRLWRLRISESYQSFGDLLTQLAAVSLKIDMIAAERFSSQNLDKYWNWLSRELDIQKQRGLVPWLSQAENSFAVFDGFQQISPGCDEHQQILNVRLASRSSILQSIDMLSDRQYEALACVTCGAIGADVHYLTPAGNEGGIDFVALLKLNASNHLFSGPGTEMRIVGQCKKYRSSVSVDRLEQFLHVMQNVRHRASRVREQLPAWFEDAKGPIVGWVISHTGFQSGASDEAKKHGIIVSDSLDLTQLLALSDSFQRRRETASGQTDLGSFCNELL